MLFSRSRVSRRRGLIFNEHVEVNVAEHCNLSCRSCSHLSPSMPRRFVEAERVYRDLKALAGAYHARRVSLIGGEPLLHPDLPSVIEAVRRSGVSDGIKLATNGVLLPRMAEECWRAIDEVLVSSYPGHELPQDQLDRCRRLAVQYAVTLKVVPVDEFRESHAALGTTDGALVERIYASCRIAHDWRCHAVADGWFYKCPAAWFLARALGLPDAATTGDGLEITGDRGFARRLLAYLESPKPLAACTFCLGSTGKRFPHEELPRKEWAAPQQRTLEDLVDLEELARSPRYI